MTVKMVVPISGKREAMRIELSMAAVDLSKEANLATSPAAGQAPAKSRSELGRHPLQMQPVAELDVAEKAGLVGAERSDRTDEHPVIQRNGEGMAGPVYLNGTLG